MNDKTPNIRFKGFTDDWEQRKFGDIGTVAMCKRIFKEQTSSEGDVPFYKIGTFGGEPDAFIDRELFKEYKSKFSYPNKGDILLSASGTIGRTIEYTGNDEYFQDSNIVWLKHGDGIDNAFLEVLYSVVDWSCEGSTIKRLYNDNFLKTKFMMPKIEEQQKIGVYFKNLDHLITLHQRKYDQLLNIKKSMLEKMFPKNGKKAPEIRFVGFTDDWEQRKLGDIGIAKSGVGFPDVEQGGSKGTPFFKVSDMNTDGNENELVIANNYVTDEQISRKRWNVVADVPAIFFAKVGAAVMLNRKRLVRFPFLLDNNTMAYVFDKEVWDCDFGKTLFETIDLTKLTQLGALPSYNSSDVEEIEIYIPSKVEQKCIGSYFKQLDNLITLHQRKLEKLENLKKSMLKQMLL